MDDGEVFMTPKGQQAPVDNTYAKIAGNNLMAQPRFGAQVQGIQQKSRKNSNIMYGKDTTEDIFAVDVCLVASGLNKEASAEKLKDFITAKGVNVVQVELLTNREKNPEARTNTY